MTVFNDKITSLQQKEGIDIVKDGNVIRMHTHITGHMLDMKAVMWEAAIVICVQYPMMRHYCDRQFKVDLT